MVNWENQLSAPLNPANLPNFTRRLLVDYGVHPGLAWSF